MDLVTYMEALRRSRLLILAITLGVLGLVAAATWTTVPLYTASSSLYFSIVGGKSATELLQGSTYSQNQVRSYALLAESPAVLDTVIAELGLETSSGALASQVSAKAISDTVILQISAIDPSPERAAAIANSVNAALASFVEQVNSADADSPGSPSVKATPIASASVPSRPSSPDWTRNLMLGLLLGVILGVAAAVARQALDTKVRTLDTMGKVTSAPVLGSVSTRTERSGSDGLWSEEFRRLASNIDYLSVGQTIRSMVITSANSNDGKTTVTVALAASMAADRRVLLVDADMRAPSVADQLGLEGAVGLSGVLAGRTQWRDAIQSAGRGRFDVLLSGEIPPNAGEMVSSGAMDALLEQLTSVYDLVLLDSPPVLPVNDAVVLARKTDGAILVANALRTRKPHLAETVDHLDRGGASILGVILNQTPRPRGNSGYGSGYGAPYGASGPRTSHGSAPRGHAAPDSALRTGQSELGGR